MGQMRQEQVAHISRAMGEKEVEGLPVGKMAVAAADTPFQMDGIRTVLEHLLIVIGFQKGGVTLLEMKDQLFAGNADVREHADPYLPAGHDKTIRVSRIMKFRKRRDQQFADADRLMGLEGNGKMVEIEATIPLGRLCDINRERIFFGEHRQPLDMIAMLVRDKDRLDPVDRQPETLQSLLRLPAGQAHIDEDGLPVIADIITVTVASGIEGGDKQGHGDKDKVFAPLFSPDHADLPAPFDKDIGPVF